jgi:hypothetical protein
MLCFRELRVDDVGRGVEGGGVARNDSRIRITTVGIKIRRSMALLCDNDCSSALSFMKLVWPHRSILQPPLQSSCQIKNAASCTSTSYAHGLALPAHVFDLPFSCGCYMKNDVNEEALLHAPLSHSMQVFSSSTCCSTNRPRSPCSDVSSYTPLMFHMLNPDILMRGRRGRSVCCSLSGSTSASLSPSSAAGAGTVGTVAARSPLFSSRSKFRNLSVRFMFLSRWPTSAGLNSAAAEVACCGTSTPPLKPARSLILYLRVMAGSSA